MFRFVARTELFNRAARVFGPRFDSIIGAVNSASYFPGRSLKSLFQRPQIHGLRGLEDLKYCSYLHNNAVPTTPLNVAPQGFGNSSAQLDHKEVKESVSPPSMSRFSSLINSSFQKESETRSTTRSMDYVRGILGEGGNQGMGGFRNGQNGLENNADMIHIKLKRNNTFVTITDSKGNIKKGIDKRRQCRISLGSVSEKKGGKQNARNAHEAVAEHAGRFARQIGVKSVVVKVNGFTHFKRKKQAILAFREGYSHSRGDQNPVVYIEDTTRKPHNGCRLPKKRRI
ncbi:hypothetical protein NMG60_11027699 [Bertholletia excelsa]